MNKHSVARLYFLCCFIGFTLMEEGQYNGVVAYLKNCKIADVPRFVWLARHWRFTKNGRKNSDGEV